MSEHQPTSSRDLDHLSPVSDEEIAETLAEDSQLPEPREHAYFFAHYLLRQLAFSKPMHFLAFMNSEGAVENLKESWDTLGQEVQAAGGKAVESSQGLGVRVQEIAHLPAAIITLPEPQGITEAFMVAAVLLPGKRWLGLFRGRPQLRYITLEYGACENEEFRTVLAEWTKRGDHLNYGDGPDPNIHAFAKAVADLIQGAPTAIGGMDPKTGVRI